MEKYLTLYHGSKSIIETPYFGGGKKNNDFGYGFYCTENKELGKEWAATSNEDGFVNQYLLDTEYLKFLHLNDCKYTILNWIAVLVEHRIFSINNPVVNRARKYLIENFSVNVNAFDVVVGYRADDSYFDYAESFLNNAITVEQLAYAMKLGKLGEQVVIKSQVAFECLKFDHAERVDSNEYYEKKVKRNDEANVLYFKTLEEERDGLFIQDIIRGGLKNDDPRIPRNICE